MLQEQSEGHDHPTRRLWLAWCAAGGTAALAPELWSVTPPTSAERRDEHRVLPLPFDPAKLKGLSERLLVSHHENNYGGAIKNLNRIEKELAALAPDAPGFLVAGLRERALGFSNSATLHELYFGNLGGEGQPAGELIAALGDRGRWEQELRAAAMSLAGGSGWVVLAFDFRRHGPVMCAAQNHTQAVAYGAPLLVLDLYEHSYHIDFGAKTSAYVDALLSNLSWEIVEQRYQRALRADAALSGKGL